MPDRPRLRWLIDAACVAAALAEALLSDSWTVSPLSTTLCVVAAAALLVRRRHPRIAFLLTLPSVVVATALLASLIALFSLAALERRRVVIVVAGLLLFGAAIPQWWGTDDPQDLLLGIIYSAMASAGAIALGTLDRTRRELARRVDDLRAAREDERRRDRMEVLALERSRIAREMHDVVSHQVSLIAVRSGAIQVASPDFGAREDARLIRGLAVETLAELRQMVTVLRARTGADEDIAPQPKLGDIPALVAASGLDVDLRLDVDGRLSAAAERTLFRATQEALTNVRKHSASGSAAITLTATGVDVVLTVTNPLTAGDHPATLPGSGHGLVGLRERAAILGGTVEVRTTADAFALELRFPRIDDAAVSAPPVLPAE